MWFCTSSLFKSILKKSCCCSSVNRQRKILIWFKCEFAWVPNGCTYADEIADEFIRFRYIESTYKSIHKRISRQSDWRSQKPLSCKMTKMRLKLLLMLACWILFIFSLIKFDIALFKFLLVVSLLALIFISVFM